MDSYIATVDGNTYELTQREFEVLRELLTHQGRIMTRQILLDKLWKYDFCELSCLWCVGINNAADLFQRNKCHYIQSNESVYC
ncbi:MAG: winged helix-turn-helix domain-containing protein [Oscillospiraceae bacterium]|nr:winged helix-turn-helix domain-containing protein [Oscillospiraceae bacterium]